MVSNARLDLPEPERPVITMRRSRGSSSETFLRLCTRAPCTAMVVRGPFTAEGFGPAAVALVDIRYLSGIEKCQLLHVYVAPFCQLRRERGLAENALIGKILARAADEPDAEIPAEVVVNIRRGTRFAHLAQMIDQRAEKLRRIFGEIPVDCCERALHALRRLFGIEQIGVDDC